MTVPGWTCSICNTFVPIGIEHSCHVSSTSVKTETLIMQRLTIIEDKLSEILEKLERFDPENKYMSPSIREFQKTTNKDLNDCPSAPALDQF